jgi:transposase
MVLDRDLNAAMNVKVVAVSSITQNACGAASAGYLATGSETSRVEARTKGDVWALSQMSMF